MIRTLVLATAGTALAAAAAAQTAAPVYVAFRFEADTAVRSFKPADLAPAQREVAALLAASCQQKLAWWTFQAAGDATHSPRLDVSLAEALDWQIQVEFFADAGPPGRVAWSGTLFKPGEFAQQVSRLRREGWGPAIVRQFEREILRPHGQALLATLQREAPLGRMVKLPDPPIATPEAPVVLPLDWERYKPLSASLFTIRCSSSDGPVTLHSAGMEARARFSPQPPAFDGIVVRLFEWQELNDRLVPIADRLDRLPTLQPVAFFLKEHRRAWAVAPPPP